MTKGRHTGTGSMSWRDPELDTSFPRTVNVLRRLGGPDNPLTLITQISRIDLYQRHLQIGRDRSVRGLVEGLKDLPCTLSRKGKGTLRGPWSGTVRDTDVLWCSFVSTPSTHRTQFTLWSGVRRRVSFRGTSD